MVNKIILVAAAIALLPAGTAASAKKELDLRISAALACAAIADGQARLRCYDAAVTTLKQALDTGKLVTKDRSAGQPAQMSGVIRSAAGAGYNSFVVLMDSGDRWEVTADHWNDPVPVAGRKATIRKGAIGSYWFAEEGQTSRRARYLGKAN